MQRLAMRPPEATRIGEGWRITVYETPPSQNTTDRENRWARARRLRVLEQEFWALRLQSGAAKLSRARLDISVFFASNRRRDALNYAGGLKQWIDALVKAGWVEDDDTLHLLPSMPRILRDTEARTEFHLYPWEG